MLFSRCQRFLTRTVLTALALGATVTSVALAKPSKPGRPGGFRMFANAINVFTVNRVQCRIFSDGSICATGSSTVGGGIWPRGSANQYVFGSGINIAGIIEPGDRSVNGFAGDTAGGFFNNTAGTSNGVPVRDIFSSNDPADAAAWPDEARVPEGDATAELFDPSLQGNIAASQGDLWFVSWEGDPANLASRTHPLGVLVETRAMGWNFPVGNQDIIYIIYTFYNITSTRPEDYAAVRPSLQPLLLEKAADFHALNTAKYGISLPEGGYRINDMFAAFTADMDVAQADANFAGVNVPFSLGYTYENTFSEQTAASLGWTFDPVDLRLGALLQRRRLRRREVPRQPDRSRDQRAGGSLALRHLLPLDRLAAGPDRRQAALPVHHRRPAADRRRLLAAEPAGREDLLRQHQQPGRHAVLPVVRSDRPGPGRLRLHHGGLHLRRAGGLGELPGRRLQRDAGPEQRRAQHPG